METPASMRKERKLVLRTRRVVYSTFFRDAVETFAGL